MTQRITLRLPADEVAYLHGLADARDRDSVSRVIRKALRFFREYGAGKRLPENTEDPVSVKEKLTYDTEKYVLGTLCKYSHRYGETGQSLRDKAGDCTECKRLRNARRVRGGKKEVAG